MSYIPTVRLDQTDAEEKPQLCVGNYQTEQQAKEQLARFVSTYSNAAEWKQRAQRIRWAKGGRQATSATVLPTI